MQLYMEESSLYNHGINHELTNFCTLNHNIIKQVQKFKIICMDTNSMNLILHCERVRSEREHRMSDVMWVWVSESARVGWWAELLCLSWFLKISSLARLCSEFWVYDLLVDTGVFAVQTVCRAEPSSQTLHSSTFQPLLTLGKFTDVTWEWWHQGLRMIR